MADGSAAVYLYCGKFRYKEGAEVKVDAEQIWATADEIESGAKELHTALEKLGYALGQLAEQRRTIMSALEDGADPEGLQIERLYESEASERDGASSAVEECEERVEDLLKTLLQDLQPTLADTKQSLLET
jgi:DNA anti-recombination protein RmuC